DAYAVLVGGFADAAAASAFLPKVKDLPAPELKRSDGKEAYDIMTYQATDPQTKKMVVKRDRVNPFRSAMVVRNPLVPNTTAARPKWDPLWKKLNEGEDYSLLKNPAAWTLVVKEYVGGTVIQQCGTGSSFLKALGLGGSKPGQGLELAAAQAHELAKFL